MNIQDNVGRTPLNLSIALGKFNSQTFTILYVQDEKITKTIIHFSGQGILAEYLIEHGASVPTNLKDWERLAIGCALRGKFI